MLRNSEVTRNESVVKLWMNKLSGDSRHRVSMTINMLVFRMCMNIWLLTLDIESKTEVAYRNPEGLCY